MNWIIVDDDAEYVRRFLDGAAASRLRPQRFQAYTSQEGLARMLAEQRNEILLISPTMLAQMDADKLPVDRTWIWSEGANVEQVGRFQAVSKYQPISQLLDRVWSQYQEAFPQAGISHDKARTCVISVYSPQGGSGKTTVSLQLCAMLARSGRQTLYVNLERACGLASVLQPLSEQDQTALDYFVVAKSPKLSANLPRFIQRDAKRGVHYLVPYSTRSRISEASEQDHLDFLLQQLRAFDRFDLIVLDLDTAWDDCTQRALSGSEGLVWMINEGSEGIDKSLAQWPISAQHGRFSSMPIQIVRNRYTGQADRREKELPQKPAAHLPYVPEWKNGLQSQNAPLPSAYETMLSGIWQALSQGELR